MRDLLGQRFGKLTVIENTDLRTNQQGVRWKCRCDCGNEKILSSANLVHHNIKSCGCLLKWNDPNYKKRIHYHAWVGIKDRCYKPNNVGYKNYGAKGVKMCDEWLNDYWAFHKWMEENNWVSGLQVDRFPNKKGDYEPSNCRLATSKMQQNNRNNNHPIEYNGLIKNAAEWANLYGMESGTLLSRLKDGWLISDALNTPVGVKFGYEKRGRNKLGQFK